MSGLSRLLLREKGRIKETNRMGMISRHAEQIGCCPQMLGHPARVREVITDQQFPTTAPTQMNSILLDYDYLFFANQTLSHMRCSCSHPMSGTLLSLFLTIKIVFIFCDFISPLNLASVCVWMPCSTRVMCDVIDNNLLRGVRLEETTYKT